VGRFSVEFEVANYGDIIRAKEGTLASDQVRRRTIVGVVDPGAAKLVLPQAVVKQLGLPLGNKIKVRYADGRRAQRREAEGAYVELLGRHDAFSAIIEPKRETALIGAIVLEDLDLLVDCHRHRLIPRDPSGPIYEIE
jgi:predicted aspartyl protease